MDFSLSMHKFYKENTGENMTVYICLFLTSENSVGFGSCMVN